MRIGIKLKLGIDNGKEMELTSWERKRMGT